MVFLHCQKKTKKIAHAHEKLNDLVAKLGLNQPKFSSKTFPILAIFPEVPVVVFIANKKVGIVINGLLQMISE